MTRCCFWDDAARIGGWFRIGNRPNERYAEMSEVRPVGIDD
jgi:hypothetical protein